MYKYRKTCTANLDLIIDGEFNFTIICYFYWLNDTILGSYER